MDFNIIHFGRHNSGFSVLGYASLSGILIGLASFILKVVLVTINLDIFLILNLIINPVIWLAAALGIAGFILFQKSIHRGKISVAAPILVGFTIVTSVILAVIFLQETIFAVKIAGIIIILVGILFLAKE
jgi:drug/metabolite transporter (DMT)-like permease